MTAPLPRKRISSWMAVLCGLLLAWVCSLLYLQYGQRHLPKTGDALLDAYLAVANERGELQKKDLPALEARFRKDPRYWELVVHCSDVYYEPTNEEREANAFGDYYAAYKSGERPLSPGLLDMYVARRENDWESEYSAKDDHARDPGRKPTQEERLAWAIAHDRATSKNIDSKHDAERTALFDQLTKTAPDYSFAWYRKSELYYQRGQYTRALECIRKGNAADNNGRLLAFPLPEYLAALDGAGPLANHPRAYTLSMKFLLNPMPDFIGIKSTHGALWKEATEKGDAPVLNDLHQYACRIGSTREHEIIAGLVCVVLLKRETAAALKQQGLTSEQRSNIGTLIGMCDKVKNDLRNISQTSPANQYINSGGASGWRQRLHGNREDMPSRMMHEDYKWTREQYRKQILPQIETIRKFDFVTMSFQT